MSNNNFGGTRNFQRRGAVNQNQGGNNGSPNKRFGASGSSFNSRGAPGGAGRFNGQPQIEGDFLQDEPYDDGNAGNQGGFGRTGGGQGFNSNMNMQKQNSYGQRPPTGGGFGGFNDNQPYNSRPSTGQQYAGPRGGGQGNMARTFQGGGFPGP